MAYIMIEGPEGAGKTEGAAWLVKTLKTAGFEVMPVHEPGDSTLGTLVRSTLSGIRKDQYERLRSYIRDGSETERLLAHLPAETYKGLEVLDTIRGDYAAIKEMMRKDSSVDRVLGALTASKEISIESLQMLFTAVRSEDMRRLAPFLARKNTVIISDRGYPSTIAYAESNSSNNEYVEFLKLINSRFPKPDLLFVLSAPAEVLLERVHKRGGPEERFDRLESIRNLISSYERNYSDAMRIDASRSRAEVHAELLKHTMGLLRRLEVEQHAKAAKPTVP